MMDPDYDRAKALALSTVRVERGADFYRVELPNGRRSVVRRAHGSETGKIAYVLETERTIHPAEYSDFHRAVWDALLHLDAEAA